MTIRHGVLDTVSALPAGKVSVPTTLLSDLFASHVFALRTMEEYLPQEAYSEAVATVQHGQPLCP